WILLTAAFASSSYKIAGELLKAGQDVQAKEWFLKGESFLDRVRIHGNPDGSLSEQINRDNGYMMGARELTWSHAETLHAIAARASVTGGLKSLKLAPPMAVQSAAKLKSVKK
ncbi:MAG: hypothetical protein EOP05_04760, partial [Proteobacteria bacterium]